MATSCADFRAFVKHSSAIAAIIGTVLTGRGFGVIDGDLLVMLDILGERAVIDGDLVKDAFCCSVLIR